MTRSTVGFVVRFAGVDTTASLTQSYPGTREAFILVSQAPPETRRAELADFLRTRRSALNPDDVGLPNGGRRRTPGLRREEVAQLAGMSVTWYTWLEQARDVRASQSVLDGLADALRMNAAERAHLMLLGRGDEAVASRARREDLDPTVRRLIENLGDSPACILGRRWDYLAWNRAFEVVFCDPRKYPEDRRNFLWSIFTDQTRRRRSLDWEASARNALARFRADNARHLGDPEFEELIDAVHAASPEFRDWWPRHEVARSGIGTKEMRHDVVGKLWFEHAVFKLEETPEQRLILYSPLPRCNTPAKVAQLLASAN
jgi:transcriptional regulator with XRE-family HTH domain